MPLSNLFKKSPKKEPVKNELFDSPKMQKKRYDAAVEYLKIFQERMPLVGGKPHAGTVISVAARLAGTSLFRAINKKDFDPGNVVLSEEVNQAYPQLLNLFAFYCKQNGMDVLARPLVTEFPDKDKPLMELAQVQVEYQDQYNEIMKKHGLDYLEGARAGMIVCSIVFNYHCIANKDIDPYVATGIVAMGVVEGAKTSPVPLKSKGTTTTSTKGAQENQATGLIRTIASSSVSGSGTRLVLGEQDAVMKEALGNGGKFILVHPEVANKLKQGGIDVYLIYVTVLIIELESKIDRIDFVGVKIEELAQEWSGKPDKQVPNHVRLIQWLKENANGFGYRQSGNSWILKK